jgi:hypothetical protein
MSARHRYLITIRGFDGMSYVAETASKARYKCYCAWCEAGFGRHVSFLEFLRKVSTLHMGAADA